MGVGGIVPKEVGIKFKAVCADGLPCGMVVLSVAIENTDEASVGCECEGAHVKASVKGIARLKPSRTGSVEIICEAVCEDVV